MNYEMIGKVMINVLLISVFISVFFFTYGVKIEKEVIINQMKVLTNDFMSHIELSGNTVNTNINKINNSMLTPENIKEMSKDDKEKLSGNKKIIKMVLIIIACLIFVVFFVVLMLVKMKKIENIREILFESSLILVFIAITEFCFVYFFGAKYISIDTNKIKLTVIKYLQKYSNLSNNEQIDEHGDEHN
jgi:glucan phosphoethanolaminetransferase (alkaline phosphatase superfamily)